MWPHGADLSQKGNARWYAERETALGASAEHDVCRSAQRPESNLILLETSGHPRLKDDWEDRVLA